MDLLNGHLRPIIEDGDTASRFQDVGVVPASSTPDGLMELGRGIGDEMARLIRDRNIRIS